MCARAKKFSPRTTAWTDICSSVIAPALLYLLYPYSRAISAFPTSMWVMQEVEQCRSSCREHEVYVPLVPMRCAHCYTQVSAGCRHSLVPTQRITAIKLRDTLVPKLPLGNPVSKAPALRAGKLELPVLNSQAGAWELAQRLTDEDMAGVCRKRQFSLSLEPAYSGLLRDVYNDERSAWEQEQPAHS